MADDVMEVVFVEIGEGEIIAYLYDRGCRVEVEELDVLIHLSHFLGLRLDAAVGIYHTVDAEVAVGRSAVLTVTAAVRPVYGRQRSWRQVPGLPSPKYNRLAGWGISR